MFCEPSSVPSVITAHIDLIAFCPKTANRIQVEAGWQAPCWETDWMLLWRRQTSVTQKIEHEPSGCYHMSSASGSPIVILPGALEPQRDSENKKEPLGGKQRDNRWNENVMEGLKDNIEEISRKVEWKGKGVRRERKKNIF